MKNKKVLIIALAAIMSVAGLAGCGTKTEEGSKAQSKAETSAASESVEQVEEDSSAEKAVIPEEVKTMFPFMTDDGKALPTYAENVKAIDNDGRYTVTELSYENIDPENYAKNLYTFTMTNAQSPEEIYGLYIMNFSSADEDYYVELGESATSQLDEAEIYAPSGTEVTYFAFATVTDDGRYTLIPVIAGNDETGYYFVRSNLRMFGYDADAFAIPESGKVGSAKVPQSNA